MNAPSLLTKKTPSFVSSVRLALVTLSISVEAIVPEFFLFHVITGFIVYLGLIPVGGYIEYSRVIEKFGAKKKMAVMKLIKMLSAIFFLVIAGCASAPDPAEVELRLLTTPGLNPDPDDRPSPVVLQVYRLSDIDGFSNARFFELYDNAQEILGQDLIHISEIELSPGADQVITVDRMTASTTHLGLLAAFRNIDSARWRVVIPTPADSRIDATVVVGDLQLSYKIDE